MKKEELEEVCRNKYPADDAEHARQAELRGRLRVADLAARIAPGLVSHTTLMGDAEGEAYIAERAVRIASKILELV